MLLINFAVICYNYPQFVPPSYISPEICLVPQFDKSTAVIYHCNWNWMPITNVLLSAPIDPLPVCAHLLSDNVHATLNTNKQRDQRPRSPYLIKKIFVKKETGFAQYF